MRFVCLSLFGEMMTNCMNTSIIGRALEKGLIQFEHINIRDFSDDKHGRVDDYPYGGGAGMLMKAEPVYKACEHAKSLTGEKTRVIYMTPKGKILTQEIAEELSKEDNLIILCGHYEGIDERALELEVTDEISIGDYVLTGGELPALILMDAVSRLIPGVLNNAESPDTESFQDGTLEYPQYTRPEEFMGKRVPEVLLSGHHENIAKYRRQQALLITQEKRPDLYEKLVLSDKDKKLLGLYPNKRK